MFLNSASYRFITAAVILVLGISGCSSRGAIPTAPQATALSRVRPPDIQRRAKVYFRIPVPGRTKPVVAVRRILPAYVSASTAAVVVIVQGQNESKPEPPQKFACKVACTGALSAPVGVDWFKLELEDKKGKVLSVGTSTVLIFQKTHNTLNFTLDGVVAQIKLVPVPAIVPVVPKSRGYVLFEALDADGNIVTPNGDYADASDNPLVFDLKSSNKALKLGVGTVSAPGMPIPFTYDGTQHVGTVTLGAAPRPGVTAKIAKASSNVALVPGIRHRIPPPLPVHVIAAGQTALSSSAPYDPSKLFISANSGVQSALLTFDETNGTYAVALAENSGAYASPPIDLGPGFDGFTTNGSTAWAELHFDNGFAFTGGLSSNPCTFGTPIGIAIGIRFCQTGNPLTVLNDTASAPLADGQERKIQIINATAYLEVVQTSGASQAVVVQGSMTPVTGAISVGTNAIIPTTVYYGDADGTVKESTTKVAKFSNSVENVIGYGTSIYAYENGGVFGVKKGSQVFESESLPIGSVVEIVTGVAGAPMLVESDGTLDVMAI